MILVNIILMMLYHFMFIVLSSWWCWRHSYDRVISISLPICIMIFPKEGVIFSYHPDVCLFQRHDDADIKEISACRLRALSSGGDLFKHHHIHLSPRSYNGATVQPDICASGWYFQISGCLPNIILMLIWWWRHQGPGGVIFLTLIILWRSPDICKHDDDVIRIWGGAQ